MQQRPMMMLSPAARACWPRPRSWRRPPAALVGERSHLSSWTPAELRCAANKVAFEQLTTAEPVLVGLGPAIDLLPGMTPHTILTSGPPLPFAQYEGGQRSAIIGAALFEGLASSQADAAEKLKQGAISLGGCHDYSAVGSLAGVYSASMPVFEVLNTTTGGRGFCNFYEVGSAALTFQLSALVPSSSTLPSINLTL